MNKLVTALCCLAFCIMGQGALADFYYSPGGTIQLRVDSTKICVKLDETSLSEADFGILSTVDRITSVASDPYAMDNFLVCDLAGGDGYVEFADSLEAMGGIYKVEPYYLDPSNQPILVGLSFCVGFKPSIDNATIDSLNAQYGVVVSRRAEDMPNIFVLSNTDTSGYDLLEIANIYHELEETEYAQPEVRARYHLQSYKIFDHYNWAQPQIKKVVGQFNVAPVWDFAGLGDDTIIVAVIDDGVTAHEDLPSSRILPGVDYDSLDNDPSPGANVAHGMAVAGLIGASHTTDSAEGTIRSTGIISMNPHCAILPIKIFDDTGGTGDITPFDLAAAITYAYASGADILSNSWGFNYSCEYSWFVIDDAIEAATTIGRGGRGCPVIFAAGNTVPAAWYGVLYPGCLPDAFSVGAIDPYDVRWPYSEYGSFELDLVAPSGDLCLEGDVLTLDQMDSAGYNPLVDSISCGSLPVFPDWDFPSFKGNDVNYDANFGGTSAAAPLVSGTASLILAKDPTLTVDEVYDILRYSAVTDLASGSITPPNNEYGYGRVDAFRAILSLARGDCNNDGKLNLSDVTVLVNHLFVTYAPLFPSNDLGDVNCDGIVGLTDVTKLSAHLFSTFEPLAIPCFEYSD